MGRACSTLFVAIALATIVFSARTARGQPAAASSSAPGDFAAPEPFSDFDHWLAEQRDGAGRACDRRAVDRFSDHFVIACGESGLWIVRKKPGGGYELVRTDDLGGPVVALFRRDERIWAEVLRREARDVHPIGGSPHSAAFPSEPEAMRSKPAPLPAPPPPPPSTSAKRPALPEGRVTQQLPGEVVIDIGRRDGLRFGDRIELSVVTDVSVGEERMQRRDVVAVGRVEAVSERFARVELGINERVPIGALARPVGDPLTKTRVAPPRAGGLWHAGFMGRPFLALDTLGGGILLDGSIGYRFESDLHLEAVVSPLGWGTGDGTPSTTPFAGFAKLSFDTRLFEVGFGLGAETIHDTSFGTDSGSGLSFVQQLRLGARDGLHLDTQSHVVLFHSRFSFTAFVGNAQIPVGERWWLLFGGGGGSPGFGYGEVGVRALLRGNGDRGSFFFTGTVGGGGVFENTSTTCTGPSSSFPCPEPVVYAGPMLGAGGEWRF